MKTLEFSLKFTRLKTAMVVVVSALVALGVTVATTPSTQAATPLGTVTVVASNDSSGPVGDVLDMTTGPDGNLWFTNQNNDSIGRISTDGVVSNYTGVGMNTPAGITAGPDGNLWFTNNNGHSIGMITTDGVVSNFTDASINFPDSITAGPDGKLWFTNWGNNSIGRITTDGVVSNFTGTGIDHPMDISAGPDGNLWFANNWNASIGRITTDGVVSNFTDAGMESPYGITAGPDGNLWFTNNSNDSIGRITTDGVVSNFTGTGIAGPTGITAGPDGNLWFVNVNNSIGRITTDGVVSNFTDPLVEAQGPISSGPDGNLWFTSTVQTMGGGGQGGPSTTQSSTTYAIATISPGPIPPFSISGTVTNLADQPIVGAVVDLRDATGLVRMAPITTTGVDGTYSFSGLNPGNFKLYVRSVPGQHGGMWYGQAKQRSGSATITVADDSTGIDVQLPPAYVSVSGTVRNSSDHASIAGAVVDLRDATGLVRMASITTTGIDGTYSFSGLNPGDYKLYVRGVPGHRGMWYGQAEQRSGSATIMVGGGGATGIDATLPSAYLD